MPVFASLRLSRATAAISTVILTLCGDYGPPRSLSSLTAPYVRPFHWQLGPCARTVIVAFSFCLSGPAASHSR
eukprot:151999-Heterocapsa_arctica.AAC.1